MSIFISKKQVFKGLLIIGTFLTLIMLNGLNSATLPPSEVDNFTNPRVQSNPHAPISINGNGEFTSANGVANESALGTLADPFIIENWTISTSGSYGISISNTNAFVIIRLCNLTKPSSSSGDGINLNNATNVIVFYNTIDGFNDGINIVNTYNVNCSTNKVVSQLNGIGVYQSYNITVEYNYAQNQGWSGIRIDESNDSVIVGNEAEDSNNGIYLLKTRNNSFIDNYCHGNTYGIEIAWGNTLNTIKLNRLNKNFEYGLKVNGNEDTKVYENDLSLNGYGPFTPTSGYTEDIHDNTIKQVNELQTGNYPEIYFYETDTTDYKEYIMDTFDTSAGPYQLKFKWIVEKNTDKNYTMFLKASISTTTENYLTWTGADFLFDLNLSYAGKSFIAFGYRYDSTSILETSHELYHFPMCYEYFSDVNNKQIRVEFYYKLTSSEWSTIESNFTTTFTPSISSSTPPGFITGFDILLVLGITSLVIIFKSIKLKKTNRE